MQTIEVHANTVGEHLIQTIDGRDIHRALEIGKDYTNWVKAQIKSLQLIENIDYIFYTQKGKNPTGGRPRSEYFFTIEIAKHIALASRTDKGRSYRQALIDLERRANEPRELTLVARMTALRSMLEMAETFDLSDDYTRMLAREALQNGIREVGNPGQQLLSASSAISQTFQVEELRDEIIKEHGIGYRHWADLRGAFGKVIRAAIQAADPDAEPFKVHKMVNGEDRLVNAWAMGYRDIALAAIGQYIDRQTNP
jgi:phage anti-repressor protein